jgi:hypothetical protein
VSEPSAQPFAVAVLASLLGLLFARTIIWLLGGNP